MRLALAASQCTTTQFLLIHFISTFRFARRASQVKQLAKVTISNNLSCLKIQGILSKFKDGIWNESDTKYAVRMNASVHNVYEVVEVIEKSKR